MNVFVPNVMWVDENKQWLAIYYPHLLLTKKRFKEYRREKD